MTHKLFNLNKNKVWNRCLYCGQFIKFSDFANNKATRKMITPDSQISSETYETYHNKCLENEKEKVIKIIKEMECA